MSFISDISSWAPTSNMTSEVKVQESSSSSLNFDDYLQLMVAMFQNQDPENAASTTDMMNMLVQMTTVESITNVTEAATMLYTSSLVGKEVTIGKYTNEGLTEITGLVTGTGTYNGKPVVFVDGVSYYLSDIMAVGKLPAVETTPTEDPPAEDPPTENTENTENTEKTEKTETENGSTENTETENGSTENGDTENNYPADNPNDP